MFHSFFIRVADKNSSRAPDFIIEFLQVGVNGLFSVLVSQDTEVVQKFELGLREFIEKNLTRDRLLYLTKRMMVS